MYFVISRCGDAPEPRERGNRGEKDVSGVDFIHSDSSGIIFSGKLNMGSSHYYPTAFASAHG